MTYDPKDLAKPVLFLRSVVLDRLTAHQRHSGSRIPHILRRQERELENYCEFVLLYTFIVALTPY